MKHLFIFAFIIAVSACSKEKDNSEAANFDPQKLETIAKTHCPPGEQLTELDISDISLDFEDLNSGSVVGLMNGTGRCALTGDIHDAWGIGWFNVTAYSSCVPNGSFWKIKSRQLLSPDVYYTFESIDPVGLPLLEMSGARDLNTIYARDHAGLRPLNCKAP